MVVLLFSLSASADEFCTNLVKITASNKKKRVDFSKGCEMFSAILKFLVKKLFFSLLNVVSKLFYFRISKKMSRNVITKPAK